MFRQVQDTKFLNQGNFQLDETKMTRDITSTCRLDFQLFGELAFLAPHQEDKQSSTLPK